MILSRSGLFLSIFVVSVASDVIQRPNVIIFVADDLGWNDVSYHDPVHQIPTPNIDALGLNGIILNRHYSMQMCTPSRAALMTGQHPIRTGMQHFVIVQDEPWGLPLDRKIMPEYFKEAGYDTYMVGKWHLGFHEKRFTPLERGFDHHYGYWGSNIDYWTKVKALEPHTPGLDFRNGSRLEWDDDRYATEAFTSVTLDYLKQHDKTRPMFMIVNHLAPHSANPSDPLQAPEDEIAKFSFISDMNRRKHAAMVSLLDQSIGKVVTGLKDAQMLQNSVIVFISDNGAPTTPPMQLNPGSNFPLRGTKNTPWEGGVRVPALIWSPQLNSNAPTISNKLFHISDWLPTLLSSAGIDYDKNAFDGVNQWSNVRNELLVNIDPVEGWSSIIKDDFKLVKKRERGRIDDWLSVANVETNLTDQTYAQLVMQSEVFRALSSNLTEEDILEGFRNSVVHCSNPPDPNHPLFCGDLKTVCLFNIKEDPCEFYDLTGKYPEVVRDMSKLLEAYEMTMVPPLNQPGDEKSDPIHHNRTWVSWSDIVESSV